jgi:tetratricopeptide (TPR) repeat protein
LFRSPLVKEFIVRVATLLAALVAFLPAAEPPKAPRFDGLGKHSRVVTKQAEAQTYFDQGLAFLYAFNHDEAIRSFAAASALDPDCAMAHWGVALANGSHINKPQQDGTREKAALAALERARKLAEPASAADRALIAALAQRYSDPPPKDREKLNRAYSAAMKKVWTEFPRDADVGALYAESLMNLRPWDLWTADGKPHPGTEELVRTLEAVLAVDPNHPLALHLYIHAVEASSDPGRAAEPADRLRDLQPGLGHLVHMPSHIDLRLGQWHKAVIANEKAIRADAAYRKKSPEQGFYHLYMAHNHHMLAFAAMMQGQSKKSLRAVRAMTAGVPREWVAVKENAAIADGFLAAPLEVMVRFGMWDDILKEPEFPEGFPIARTLRHHARGVAYAAKGRPKQAREELAAFRAAARRTPEEAHFGNNKAADLYAVAGPMLEGEILASEGKLKEAVGALRRAVKQEDALKYDEPPDWVIPVRHPLGALLLKADQAKEAEEVYRADLKKWPNNVWSLRGLAASLEAQGKEEAARAARQRFIEAGKHADVKIGSSCLCVPEDSAPRR